MESRSASKPGTRRGEAKPMARSVEIIKRSIPYKLIPTIRDKQTGKFSKFENKNSKQVYPEEYILIAKKK